jgi:hypothetical protein
MTTPTGWRALCAELHQCLEYIDRTFDVPIPGTLLDRARAALAQPEPESAATQLAARSLLEKVARMGDCIGQQTVAEIAAVSSQAAAWLDANPPGQPVAIEPRGCPTPGACSCVEPVAQPEPEGVSPDHVNLIAFAYGKESWATWLKTGGCLESAHCEMSELLLAAITRFTRPTIPPVPQQPLT